MDAVQRSIIRIRQRVLAKWQWERAALDLRRREAPRRRRASPHGTRGHVWCLPGRPLPQTILYKAAAQAGFTCSRLPRRHTKIIVFWQDQTVKSPPVLVRILARRTQVLNLRCLDISKSHVSKRFAEAFGYSVMVDPTATKGRLVEKPEQNAAHAGRVICGPTPALPGHCYQREVDNVVGDLVEDLRVPVIGGTMPFAYRKLRPFRDRFSNTNKIVELVEVADVLTPEEQAGLLRLRNLMGADFMEADCLRDRRDQKLYVVDINVTPWGPPNHLPEHLAEIALTRWAAAIETEFVIHGSARRFPSASGT